MIENSKLRDNKLKSQEEYNTFIPSNNEQRLIKVSVITNPNSPKTSQIEPNHLLQHFRIKRPEISSRPSFIRTKHSLNKSTDFPKGISSTKQQSDIKISNIPNQFDEGSNLYDINHFQSKRENNILFSKTLQISKLNENKESIDDANERVA